MKEFIMKKKLTKEGIGLLYILRLTLPIKFETICVFLMAVENFSQLNTHNNHEKYFSFFLL